MEQERLIQNLADAGCTGELTQKIMRFCGDGNLPDAL